MFKIITKTATQKLFATALVAATLSVAMLGSAEAKWGRKGAVLGGLGAALAIGVVGAAIANGNSFDEPDYGYRRVCRREPQFNDYGDYVGRVRVCRNVAY